MGDFLVKREVERERESVCVIRRELNKGCEEFREKEEENSRE